MSEKLPPYLRRRRRRLIIAAMTVVVAVGAITFYVLRGEGPEMQPTMNAKQAIDRVEKLIQDLIAQLPAGARLEGLGNSDDIPCDDPDDGGPKGRILVEHTYWIRGIPVAPEHNQGYFDTLDRHWKSLGYREKDKYQTGHHLVLRYSDPQGFRIEMTTSAEGDALSVSSQSPCVWPNGTPEPKYD